jgi:hypothetical protein
MSKIITRRGLLGGLGCILAAPAIVRAASLMTVKSQPIAFNLSNYFTDEDAWHAPRSLNVWWCTDKANRLDAALDAGYTHVTADDKPISKLIAYTDDDRPVFAYLLKDAE